MERDHRPEKVGGKDAKIACAAETIKPSKTGNIGKATGCSSL